MNHEAAVYRIGDLMHGRLEGSDRTDVLAHIGACKECRSLSETYVLLADALSGEGSETVSEHPSSTGLVDYALDEERLDPEERDGIATHVMECSTCAAELEAVVHAEADVDAEEEPPASVAPSRARSYFGRAAALAASVMLALLAYPAYLGLFEVPRIKDRLVSLEAKRPATGSEILGGPITPVLIHQPLRSGTETVVPILANEPYVTVIVDPGSLEEYAGAESVLFEIRTAGGAVTWSWTLPEQEFRERARSTGVYFRVPVDALSEPRMALAVRLGPDEDDIVFEAPFEVTRSD